MTTDVRRWQEDALAAFTWIAAMYEQAQTLWDDAERYFQEAGWTPISEGGFGGNAMSQKDMSESPFIYLKALSAMPKEGLDEYPCVMPVLGICFHDEVRVGPVLYAGDIRWAKKPTDGHWVAFGALTGYRERFDRSPSSGPIRLATPTVVGAKRFPAVEQMRWFEVPLGAVSSAQQLKAIVAAAIEMARGDDRPAIEVAASYSAAV